MACMADISEEDLKLMQSVADDIFKEMLEMGRYRQTNSKLGFMFCYESYSKLKRKFKFVSNVAGVKDE